MRISTLLAIFYQALFHVQVPRQDLPHFPVPENLVLDIRLFEARSENLDRDRLADLDFSISTDGRGVTANQWLGTIAKKVPEAYLAALAYETVAVKGAVARTSLSGGARSFNVEIHLDNYHPSSAFESRIQTESVRGTTQLKELTREVNLQVSQTTVWSGRDLELSATDYISHFREYRDRGHRGVLYERLRMNTIFLIIAVTPRLLSENEASLLRPEKLSPPPGNELPELDNPLGAPLDGTVVVGFELDPSGIPMNPQIVRTSLPEANPRILGEISTWRFPPPQGSGPGRVWGQVELKLEIP